MEAFSDISPYGWHKCESFWTNNHNYHPIGILKMKENTSALMESRGERRFVKFDTIEAAMMTVADVINKADGNGGAWNSNDVTVQKKYSDYLATVLPRYTNSLA
ncbi:MAG: hypothetical protein WCP52_00150 [Bacteroidota bacterium]